ncbi:putative O-glycosylation ligase, exosortase A system-associated [Emcibacter sp. SYSU 3D8]|uniref:putative O-glycosylation ligase, exosortase A system-associated n=1 Tax=Emcibacter sp. SYSU 3D8 TaxID=3133969 RepID=UPI0031FE7E37
MRSLFVLVLVFSWIPAIFYAPYLGVLAWMWVSYMNPHKMAAGMVSTFPVAEVIAIATLLSWVVSREPKNLEMRPVVVLLLVFTAFSTITTVLAVNPGVAWPKWETFVKVMLFTLIAIPLINNRYRLHAMIWVMVISCAYFAMRGGLFTLLSGGAYRVWGPPGTFHGDNNGIAMTFLMILPLLRYLQIQNDNRFAWLCFLAAQILTLLAVFGTMSRGALVALTAMTVYLLIRSRRFGTFALIVAAGALAFYLMPQDMKDRQATTVSYQQDASAIGRLTMWKYAIDVANERPLTGGGFNIFYDNPTRARLLPRNADGVPEEGRAAHSVYFEVLGEHGYPGLLLYLSVLAGGFFSAERIYRKARKRPDTKWAADLAYMSQYSLIGFAVAGAFLSKATFDLCYHVLALIVITGILADRAAKEPVPDTIPPGDPILSFFLKPRVKGFKPPKYKPGRPAPGS